jgi:hypothetical protein
MHIRNKKIMRKLSLIFVCSVLPISAQATHFQGPLLVNDAFVKTNGNIISGNFSGTLTSPAITVSSTSPVIILNSTVTGPGDLIYTAGGNVEIDNTVGTGTNPNVVNTQKGYFVHAEKPVSLSVNNCTVTGTSMGVYVHGYSGNYTHTNTITIYNNQFNNIDGRPSDGKSGYVTNGDYNAHTIQFNNVVGVPDIEISWNQSINLPLQGDVGAIISMYDSSGTSTSPIMIHDNYLQGALPSDPGVDKYAGGGILTDGTASDTATNASAWVNVYNNQIVASANYGISFAAGNNNNAYNNRVVSSGFTTSGAFYPMTYANGVNNYNNYNQPATVFFNNLIQNNVVGYIGGTPGAPTVPRRSDHYLPGQASTVVNNWWTPNDAAHPTLADEANELAMWEAKQAFNKKKVGATLN